MKLSQTTIDTFKLYHRGFAYAAVKMDAYWSAEILDLRQDHIHGPGSTGIMTANKAAALRAALHTIDMMIADSRTA